MYNYQIFLNFDVADKVSVTVSFNEKHHCSQNHKLMLAESHIVVGKITDHCWQNHKLLLAESHIIVGTITKYYWQNDKHLLAESQINVYTITNNW